MRILLALMFLILSAGGVRADTVAAANAALEAYGKGDRAALAKLATGADADPWLVAEELLFRGERGAATALAAASNHPDLAALGAWLGKQQTYPTDPEARSALSIALALIGEGKAKEARAAIEGLSTLVADPTNVRIVSARAVALLRLGRRAEAIPIFTRAAEMATKLGWIRRAAESLAAATRAAIDAGTPHLGTTPARARLAIEQRRGNPAGQVAALTDLGEAYRALSEPIRAETELRKAHEIAAKSGDRPGAARVELQLGHVALDRGKPDAAQSHFSAAQELAAKTGEQALVAGALAGKARLAQGRGDLESACALMEAAVAIYERAGDPKGLATVLSDLGNLYRTLGEPEYAARSFARARELLDAIGDRTALVMVLTNQAALLAANRRNRESILKYEEALAGARKLGDAYGAALILGNLGEVLTREARFARAKRSLEESIRIRGELGDRAGIGIVLGNLGLVYAGLGKPERAVEVLSKALAISSEYGPAEAALLQARSLAAAYYELTRYDDSAQAARRAIGYLNELCRKLSADEAARTRLRESAIFGIGLEAAVLAGDPAAAFSFIEARRASRILEFPGVAELRETVRLPEELRAAVVAALAAEADARRSFRAALDARSPVDVERTKTDHAAARKATDVALERLRSEAPLFADLYFPKLPAFKEALALLAPGDAVVLFGSGLRRVYALVATRQGTRIVSLGTRAEVSAACASLNLSDLMELTDGVLADARRVLVEPLGLKPEVRRVLVSPLGVATSALFPDRAVVCLPSATAWARLRAAPSTGGKETLDLGPDAGQSRWSDTIPRDEGRWRTVHLAAPATVDLRTPVANRSKRTNEGLAIAQHIAGIRVPADLVVLSNVAGAPGPGFDAEGLDFVTRSFMVAGAPRVLVTLWRVDEKAKRAFLTEFFRLWNPPDGGKPLPAAEAVRKAQEHVRTQEGWDHPHYWAAWQLWGV